MKLVPISIVIPTKDRPVALARTIKSILASTLVPAEFVIVDASETNQQRAQIGNLFGNSARVPAAIVQPATRAGAAAQRNQAVALARNEYILFCDDDIICEPDCVERLWQAIRDNSRIGGASAAIVNQAFSRPGLLTRTVIAAIAEPEGGGYAGRIVGPAIAFLPERPAVGAAFPEAVPVQWLNTTCTLYRRNCLPDPPFDPFFTGYSLGEDMATSLRVAKRARLINVPAARIFHDSQPGAHKADAAALARMDVVNRYYIMDTVMEKRRWRDKAAFLLWEFFLIGRSALQKRDRLTFWRMVRGRLIALALIVRRNAVRFAE